MAEAIKILVIDDSEDDRFLYRRTLKADTETAYEITEHDNGEDGCACIADVKPDCVLLDYSLPGRNGIEVLKRIRGKHPFVAIVMLTGQGNESVAVTAMREGAQNYISKASITPETLQRSVRVAIDNCALQRNVHEQQMSLEIFTRALAHDLKEPVRTILSFLDLITQNVSPEKTDKYFAYITRAAERMSAMIDTVYFYMRLDNAAQKIVTEACDSGQALENAKENLAALIHERKAVITADALPMVQANRMQLIQIMQNLLSNAIQHCTAVPAIHIGCKKLDGQWQFCVSDNGSGIAAEYRDRIFEPFKRLSSPKEDGLGLGLAICKKIIESAGGKIWCEAGLSQGTVFCFTFADAVAETVAAPTHIASAGGGKIANILIVEDNEADVELTRFALIEKQKMQCRLFVARNGQEALARMQENKATENETNLILLDINMPGMDGFELLRQLREAKTFSAVPVLMCTTSTYDKDVEQAKALGAAGYLIKPLDFAKFKSALEPIGSLDLRAGEGGSVLTRVGA